MSQYVDYLSFIILLVTIFFMLQFWVRRQLNKLEDSMKLVLNVKSIMGFIHVFFGIFVVLLLILSWFILNWEMTKERKHLEDMYGQLAKNYAYELQQAGHEQISITTDNTDTRYIQMIEKIK